VATQDGFETGDGWRLFASIALVIAGVMRIFDSFYAFRAKTVLPDAIFGSSLKTYGWWYLLVGILLLVAAGGVLQRSQWARWVGVIAGGIMAISAVWWMPYYPVWSLVYVGIGFLVVYALVAHGSRVTSVA
jgi:uncharacterized membrane protein YpjA